VKRPIIFLKGMCEVQVPLDFDISSGDYEKPIRVAPNVWYGVTDKLTVGLTHDEGIYLANDFGRVYDDVGLRAKHRLKSCNSSEIALDVGVVSPMLSDPFLVQGVIGVDMKWWNRTGRWGLWGNPNACIGLNEREFYNEDILKAPVSAIVQATPKLAIGLTSGIIGPFDGFGDYFEIPVGGLVFYNLCKGRQDVFARVEFDNLAGKNSTSDFRSLFAGANFRF
jgi:hypothetical protein